eukprot:CAMPEP_0182443250 /NCGR_PEP_ID=MMETSP1172-20130603/2023_1 /TAXON_ID=708627 /ORGANISM="Timspurckia oligopyrenoides, Strain CCMP3278" /LENGTH=177 /DNA_ID=CAMNT_0024638451 /DNA_START=111 /DNA_END=644 /DNA_ORIENTATION=+
MRLSGIGVQSWGSSLSQMGMWNAHGSSDFVLGGIREASKKAKGSTKNGRDSRGKHMGPKVVDGQIVKAGMILMRQRGTTAHPAVGVGRGRDNTLFALESGRVRFLRMRAPKTKFHERVFLTIQPPAQEGVNQNVLGVRFSRLPRKRIKYPVYKEPLERTNRYTRIANAATLEEALKM